MFRPFNYNDLAGSEIIYLLQINWAGGIYRFSTYPIDIADNNGDLISYAGGLTDPEINTNISSTGLDLNSDTVPIEIIFNNVDLVKELRLGRSLDFAEAEISAVTSKNNNIDQTFENRYKLFSGEIIQPIIGDPARPVGWAAFSIERDAGVRPQLIPATTHIINTETFSTAHAESAEGKIYPIVFGKPSSNNGISSAANRGVTPAYCVKIANNSTDWRVLIAGHAVEATTVIVRSYDGHTATLSVLTDVDNLGNVYSYVNIYGSGVGNPYYFREKTITNIYATGIARVETSVSHGYHDRQDLYFVNTDSTPDINGPQTTSDSAVVDANEFNLLKVITLAGTTGRVGIPRAQDFTMFVEWGASAGGMSNPFGPGVLLGGGDVCRWALSHTKLKIDNSAWQAVNPILNNYEFGGYINEQVNPLQWLEDNIIKYLPCAVVNGPAGLRPIINLMFISLYLRPVAMAEITSNSDWQQTGPLQTISDPSTITNIAQLKFGYTVFNNDFMYSITSDPDYDGSKNNIQTGDQIASINTYGRRQKDLKCAYIYDQLTASRVIQDQLQSTIQPVVICEFEAAQHWGFLQVGDIISLNDSNLYLVNCLSQITGKTWISGGLWSYQVQINYDININSREV
jgi:hypothetical protein